MPSSLSLNNIIPVSVTLAPVGSPGPTFNQALILGSSTVITYPARLQSYTSTSQILAAGFTTTSPEYIAASIYFAQTPAPTYLQIGRQLTTAITEVSVGSGNLGLGNVVGDVLTVTGGSGSSATLLVTNIGASGALAYESTTATTGVNLSTITLASVATAQVGMTITGTGIPFGTTITSLVSTTATLSNPTTVPLSTTAVILSGISILTGGVGYTTGNGLSVTSSGSPSPLPEINILAVGETPLQALVACRAASTQWYACMFVGTASGAGIDSDILSMAGFIESASPFSTYFVTSGDAAILSDTQVVTTGTATIGTTAVTVASGAGTANGQYVTGVGVPPGTTVSSGGGTTSIVLSLAVYAPLTSTALTFSGSVFATLQALGYRRTFPMYSTTQSGIYPNNIYSCAAPMGYAMGANTGNVSSYFTLAFKPMVGVATEPLTQTQFQTVCGLPNRTVIGQNANAYLDWNSGSFNFLMNGTVPSGSFYDITLFLDVLVSQIQYNAMNLLVELPSVPLNQAGISQMINVVTQACVNLQNVGFINSSGVWYGPTVGPISSGVSLPKGFYVYSPPITSLTQAARAARQFPPLTVLIILAESGQSLAISVEVQP